MKTVDLHYATGSEVLSSYWGFLSGGGLVIRDQIPLEVGDEVCLSVYVGADDEPQRISGRVVRRAEGIVIALAPGESHGRLLSAALADDRNELERVLSDARNGLAPI